MVSVGSLSGFNAPVSLSASGLPAGVTAQFTPGSVVPTGNASLALAAATTAARGTFPLTITATGGGVTHSTSGSLRVDFGLVPVCYGAFTGVVSDAVSGAPVAGARMTVSFAGSATTDANGRYAYPQVPLGSDGSPVSYTLQASAGGYWGGGGSGVAACGQSTTVNIQMTPRLTGTASGAVTVGVPDPNNLTLGRTVTDSGTPIAGASVSFTSVDTFSTGATGLYQTGPLQLNANNAPRTYYPLVSAPGYWSVLSGGVGIEPGQNAAPASRWCRSAPAAISGTVVYGDTGLPAADVTVTAFQTIGVDPYGGTSYSTKTGSAGEVSFPAALLNYNNASARYTLTVSSQPGYNGITTSVSLARCGDSAALALQLPAIPRYTLSGHVYDQDTDAPLAGAAVRALGNDRATTDASGAFTVTGLLSGSDGVQPVTASVSAALAGYFERSTILSVTPNQVTSVDLRLLRERPGAIAGTVRDAASHAPIAGASVQLPGTHPTGVDGAFQSGPIVLANNQPQQIGFGTTAPGYWPAHTQVTVQSDQTATVEVNLLAVCNGADITGQVLDATTQQPIAGAQVSVGSYLNPDSYRVSATDASGTYRLVDVPVGGNNTPQQVVVTAQATGYYTQSTIVTVFCGATVVLDFGRTHILGTIQGTVTSLDTGQAIAGVFVGSEFGGATSTDSLGHYTLADAPLGAGGADRTWRVTAAPAGFPAQTLPVTVGAAAPATLDFGFRAVTPTPTPAISPTPSPTGSPTASPTPSHSPSATTTATSTSSATPTGTPTSTATSTPTSAPSRTTTASPSATTKATHLATHTPTPTGTSTPTPPSPPTAKASRTVTSTATSTRTATPKRCDRGGHGDGRRDERDDGRRGGDRATTPASPTATPTRTPTSEDRPAPRPERPSPAASGPCDSPSSSSKARPGSPR